LPQGFDIKSIGSPFIEIQSVDSTNSYARTALDTDKFLPQGTSFFAHEQSSGKGQRGKSWISAKDLNIALSIILRPAEIFSEKKTIEDQKVSFIMLVAVAAIRFFESYAKDHIRIKWPNDIYWKDRKAGGILIESSLGHVDPHDDWAIVGIGININQTEFPKDLPNPVSLKQITGKDFQPVVLAKEFCSFLQSEIEKFKVKGFEKLLSDYNELLYRRNELCRFKKDNRIFEAVIKSVQADGKLQVQHSFEESFQVGQVEMIYK
jgi:BirA family biotin operon repressor/biotin-[acetyl-CoA-carboxylase] ligase